MDASAGLQLLEHARDLVEIGWCRGADARNGSGAAVDPWFHGAASWSLLGAIVAVLEREATLHGEVPLEELARALYMLADVVDTDSLASWNDASGRSQADVVAALTGAIGLYTITYSPAHAS